MRNEAMGRRERKKLATRAALATAALELSLDNGLDQVTVEQIADAADVSPRTFFNYFSSKEQAIVAADSGGLQTLLATLDARPADEPVTVSLRHAVLAVAEQIPDRQRLRQLRLLRRSPALLPHQLASYEAAEQRLIIAVAARTGTDPERDLYPALLAAATIAALRVAVAHWLATDNPGGPNAVDDLASLLRTALNQLGHGFDSRTANPNPAACSPMS